MASTTTEERLPGGGTLSAISNAAVRIMSEYTGRGPTKARTSIRDDVVLIVMQDTLTKADRTLLAAGQADFVMETRHRFQMTMRDDLVGAVEMLLQRKVIAFMSANHPNPDMAAEIFVLEPAAQSNGQLPSTA